jgi:hypothetical protein
METMLLKKSALLSLDLHVKHHVPSTTVQTIDSEVSDLVNHKMTAVMNIVHNVLVDGGVTEVLAMQVRQAIQGHPLCSTLDSKSGPMRSQLSRLSYYK